jgi:hypothetical protein
LGLVGQPNERTVEHPNASREALCSKSQLDDAAALAAWPCQIVTLEASEGLTNPVTVGVQGPFSNGANIAGFEGISPAHSDEVHRKLVLYRTLQTAASSPEYWAVPNEIGNVIKRLTFHPESCA